jgi:hypothetical protein
MFILNTPVAVYSSILQYTPVISILGSTLRSAVYSGYTRGILITHNLKAHTLHGFRALSSIARRELRK